MRQSTEVFDLGEIGEQPQTNRPPSGNGTQPRRFSVEPRHDPGPRSSPLSEQLSLFVPGAGQLAGGSTSVGLFYLSTMGLIIAVGWAVLATLDRLPPTLEALGLPRQGGIWVLFFCYGAIALLHVTSVLAGRRADRARRPTPPWLAGTASFLVPGWGQLLNGDRKRSAVFVAGLWLTAALWILASPAMAALMARHALVHPSWLGAWISPVTRFALPVVLWTLTVYDATVSAAHRR